MCVFIRAERSVGYHDLAFTSTAEASALSEIRTLKTSSKLLLRLHGSFMIVAWIGAASIGIVIARYYRQTWVGASCCSKDLWFGVSCRESVFCNVSCKPTRPYESLYFSPILKFIDWNFTFSYNFNFNVVSL